MQSQTIEILVIEDNLSEAGLIKELLSESGQQEFSIQHVQTLVEGLALLRSADFDLVLLDLGLPDSQGLETAQSMRNQTQLTPIVVLTTLDDEDVALKSLQMDIQDYLIKDEINASQLKRAIRYAIQYKRAEEALRETVKLQDVNEALQVEIAKRSEAEAALQETEKQLRNIIENSTNLFYMHGTDQVFTYMSPQSRQFFDCEPEEAMGRWTELITDNPVNMAAIEATQQAIDTGERQPPYIVECIGKRGRIIWVEVIESPIVQDGRTVAIVGSLTDITERKRAEEALRESEHRFASFMLHMPAAAWMKDLQGRFVYANADTARAFSTPLTGLLGKTDWDFFPPETARQFAENDSRVLSEGGSLQTIEVLRQADAIEHYSLVSKFAVAGPDGKPAYIAGVAFDITELKRVEEELRESQRALSTLMSNLPGMAYRCRNDKEWTMEFVSDGCVELTGYQQAGLVQNTKISYAQLIHPDDQESVWNDVQAALQEKRPFELVYRIRTAAGVEKWVWERGMGIFGPDGELLALEGFITDITERKRMEVELEHLASFPRLNPTPVIEMDFDGKVTFCNNAMEKILGRTICLDDSNPFIPRDLPDIIRDLQQKQLRQFTRTVEMGDLVFDELIYLVPEFNTVRIYSMDITERRRLEEDRSRLAAIVESSDDAIIAKTLDGIIVDWNKGAEKLYGYTSSEIKGRHVSLLVPADRDDELPMVLEKIGLGENVEHIETIRVKKDGRQIPVSLAISPIRDRSGSITGVSTIAHDITERKRTQEKIEELNRNLAASAAELALANQELEAFNYTVAHDLRNPLNIISSYCQAIRELCGCQLDVNCKEYLQEAYNGTLRMNQLIGDLLNFSRLAHVEPLREPVDLSSVAQQVSAELKSAEPERRVSFLIADGIEVNADANMMRVVLNNLLGNAWKYTGKREEAVIEFGATEIDGKPAWFVRDNGEGFDMEHADKLFVPFRRLPGAEEFRGFGVGLATVERIIRHHGGKIWAEGEPDKGATFWFTLSADGVPT